MVNKVKLSKIGNSSGVILPKEVIDKLNLSQGDELNITVSHHGIELTPYDAEFLNDLEIAEEIMKEDRDVLHKLAQ